MKKMVSLLIVCTVITGLVMSGCEQKRESEKAFDRLQKKAGDLERKGS